MSYTFRYLAKGLAWGMWIKIDCAAYPLAGFLEESFFVTENLHFSDNVLDRDDPGYIAYINARHESFRQGLLLIADAFSATISTPTVIRVLEIGEVLTDFQNECYGYGIAGWVIQEFKLDVQLPAIHFDHEQNRYIFPYYIPNV